MKFPRSPRFPRYVLDDAGPNGLVEKYRAVIAPRRSPLRRKMILGAFVLFAVALIVFFASANGCTPRRMAKGAGRSLTHQVTDDSDFYDDDATADRGGNAPPPAHPSTPGKVITRIINQPAPKNLKGIDTGLTALAWIAIAGIVAGMFLYFLAPPAHAISWPIVGASGTALALALLLKTTLWLIPWISAALLLVGVAVFLYELYLKLNPAPAASSAASNAASTPAASVTPAPQPPTPGQQ